MNKQKASYENSIIVETFVKTLLRTIYSTQLKKIEKKEIINTDLIPEIKESITKKELFKKKKTIPLTPSILQEFKQNDKPISKGKFLNKMPRKIPVQNRLIQKHPIPTYNLPKGEFGKIDSLIKNPTITTIECGGENKNIMIIKSGLKQPTPISLSSSEINKIIEKIAREARIPVIEGLFRAAIRDFVINAVISPEIGTRFVIRKVNPYALLEPNQR